MTKLFIVIFSSLLLFTHSIGAPEQARENIEQFYQAHPALQKLPTKQRIKLISAYFLGKPYLLGPLGEGPEGLFDQNPLYRTDAFDCVTYVSTVLAIANAKNIHDFEQKMKEINYANGHVSFIDRNHFMSVDWNPNNLNNGLISEYTNKIVGTDGQPLTVTAVTTIDKPAWYQRLTHNHIKLAKSLTEQEQQQRLEELKQLGKALPVQKSALDYLPLTAMFDQQGKPIPFVFKQIPDSSIIEIVRPDWNIKDKVGTNMHVSHLGFAIKTKQGLMFREASLLEKEVTDVLLADYLKKYLDSPTVKGISIWTIN